MSYAVGSDISLNDVYKLAQDIAEEFDLLAQNYGIDNMRSLVEKIIGALELLESTVKIIAYLETEVADALSNNSRLSSLKNVSDQDRSHLKQCFEEAEESWLQEVTALKTQLSSLKTENEQLRSNLSFEKKSSFSSDETFENVIKDRDNIIHELEHSLKQQKKHLKELACNVDALNCRVKELVKKNQNLHIRNQEGKNRITQLIMDKNDCKSELICLRKENALLTENISELVRCTIIKYEDSEKPFTGESCEESLRKDIRQHIKIEMKLLEKVKKLQSELQFERCKSQKYEEELLKTNAANNSQIHQFFHLFLGVTSISKFCWI